MNFAEYREVPVQAQLDFSLWQTSAQIKNLKLQSQRSTLEAKGSIDSFRGPEVHMEYTGTIDLPQAGAILRTNLLRKGTANFSGNGEFKAGKYQASGKLAAREVDYSDRGVQVRNAALSGDFRADESGLQLKNVISHLLGGDVTGTIELKSAAQSSGQAQLKLARLSLTELSRSFSTRDLPLDRLKLAGSVNGDLKFAWKGSPSRGAAEFALAFAPPATTAAGQLAPNGTIRGSYDLRDGTLELRPLQLATAATKLDASGRIGTRTAALNLSLATSDLNEIEGVLNSFGQQGSLPLDLGGQASFAGTVNGSFRDPQINGHLQATNFTYVYMPAPNQSQPALAHAAAPTQTVGSLPQPALHPTRIHFDSFAGDIAYSNSHTALHHAVIQRGGATLTGDASATLHNGEFTDQSPFDLQLAVKDGDATRFQEMIGTDYPVTGRVNLALKAAGTRDNLNGRGAITLRNATLWGRPLDSLSSDVILRNNDFALSNVKLKAPGGSVQGSGSYNLKTRQIAADFLSDDIQLARVPEAQLEKLSTKGVASFKLHASGTLDTPVVDAHVRVGKLVLNDEHVGDLSLDAITHGEDLVVTGRSNFEHANLNLDGNLSLRDNLPGTFDVQFKDLDIDPFLSSEIKGRLTGHSAIAGAAHVTGPLRQPKALTGYLKVDAFHAEIEKIAIQSNGPLEVALANQTVSVKQFELTTPDSRLTLRGDVHLDGQRALDVMAEGSVNAALLQTFDPDLTSTGHANLNVRVGGTVEKPVMEGRVEVAHVSLSNIDLPAALADVNGTLVFNQSRLEIEKLTGKIGGGTVEFSGYIGYANAINFNITSQGHDIRFRYAGVSLTADQTLKLQGTLKNATASGDITITRFAQIPSADLAAALANTSPPIPNATSPLNNLHLDIHIRSAPELTVQTTLAKLSGDADLRVRGTALNPVLLGRVNMAQGDIKINGQKYFLERGDLTFANPVRIDPILDVEATTRVRDYDITIGLHGTMERLLTTYRSDPPLSSEDILSLLAFGRTQSETALGSSVTGGGFGEAGASALVGAAINQAVSNRVSRLFGVSAIRINPAAGGPDNNPNARLTVEQQVSSDVTITYITNLARSAQQVLQFEYNVTRDYTISAIRDENGVVSFDLLIRKRKK
jgi:translocation and assembly module TamB